MIIDFFVLSLWLLLILLPFLLLTLFAFHNLACYPAYIKNPNMPLPSPLSLSHVRFIPSSMNLRLQYVLINLACPSHRILFWVRLTLRNRWNATAADILRSIIRRVKASKYPWVKEGHWARSSQGTSSEKFLKKTVVYVVGKRPHVWNASTLLKALPTISWCSRSVCNTMLTRLVSPMFVFSKIHR